MRLREEFNILKRRVTCLEGSHQYEIKNEYGMDESACQTWMEFKDRRIRCKHCNKEAPSGYVKVPDNKPTENDL